MELLSLFFGQVFCILLVSDLEQVIRVGGRAASCNIFRKICDDILNIVDHVDLEHSRFGEVQVHTQVLALSTALSDYFSAINLVQI